MPDVQGEEMGADEEMGDASADPDNPSTAGSSNAQDTPTNLSAIPTPIIAAPIVVQPAVDPTSTPAPLVATPIVVPPAVDPTLTPPVVAAPVSPKKSSASVAAKDTAVILATVDLSAGVAMAHSHVANDMPVEASDPNTLSASASAQATPNTSKSGATADAPAPARPRPKPLPKKAKAGGDAPPTPKRSGPGLAAMLAAAKATADEDGGTGGAGAAKAVVGREKMVPTVSKASCPEDAPAWLQNGFEEVTRLPLGQEYQDLLRALIDLERAYDFKNRAGQVGRRFKKEPKIGNLDAFDKQWWMWWRGLQLNWRNQGVNGKRLPPGEYGRGWEGMVAPGQNGALSAVAMLYWWGTQGGEGSVGWRAAVVEATWVLRGLEAAANAPDSSSVAP
ncbi:hypothetical protein FB451DRAFT_1394306 [Mycena latifolia]|nr:hypothetical protein FB451DRAFT_1394306 [Mycena latifolia]